MLKLKKLGALTAAMALSLSMTTIPAAAEEIKYEDVKVGDWFYNDVMKMTQAKLANGYVENDLRYFKPSGKMTAAECLLFCSRATQIDTNTQVKIEQDHAGEVKEALPSDIAKWPTAPRELAVAIESNILSLEELQELTNADVLGKAITREDICLYLVRAMQLEPLTKSLKTYSLGFEDRDDIDPELQPYVYVLNTYGIVNGMEGNRFEPQGKVTRAQMTTMLSRAVSFMETAGIKVELPAYTSYDWKAGIIESITPTLGDSVLLTMKSEFEEPFTCTLINGIGIYKDNMRTDLKALKEGQYIRMNLTPTGAVNEVRLGGELRSRSGELVRLEDDQVVLRISGEEVPFEIDRFTLISAGSKAGGLEVIDKDAGYTSATCQVDSLGHLATLKLAGGTDRVCGLVKSVSTVNGITTVNVTLPDGLVTPYPLPAGIPVQVDGEKSALTGSLAGKYVELRVGSDDGKVASVDVDTKSTYVQGSIRRLGSSSNRTVNIYDTLSKKENTYTVSDSVLTYNGQVVSFSTLERGMFVTAKVADKKIITLDAFPGETTAEGVLDSITYGTTTTLNVTLTDGTPATYQLDITDLPSIVRDDKTSSVDQLRPGDSLLLYIRYHQVSKIEATSQTANQTGTILSLNLTLGGADLVVQAPDGTKTTYTISETTPVTQGSTHTNLYALKPGFTVALVTSGNTVVSVEITSSSASSSQLTGTIFPNDSNQYITVLVNGADGAQSSPITVDIRSARLLSMSGSELALGNLEAGDTVICYGTYSGGTFRASIVIRQN